MSEPFFEDALKLLAPLAASLPEGNPTPLQARAIKRATNAMVMVLLRPSLEQASRAEARIALMMGQVPNIDVVLESLEAAARQVIKFKQAPM